MRMNICELCSSISETYKDNAKKVVLINTSDVYEGKCTNHTFVDNKNLKGQFKKTFKPNDILYSEIRPANRRFAYIDFDTKDYIASTKLMVIRANKGVNPKYLYQLLRNNTTINTLQMLAESRSGTFPQITFSELSNIEIDVPSEENQDLIVTILSSLDAKIETNNKLNEKLEEMAQAIFKSWFVDFEPFKDKPFHETELGMIPEGWEVLSLTDIATFTNGLAMQKFRPNYKEPHLPVLKIKELRQGFCDDTSEICIDDISDDFIADDGDIIFSWSGTLLVDIWCGGKCGVNQHLFKVTSEKYSKWFFYFWIKRHLAEFIRIAKDKAVTMGHIKRGHLTNALVVVPNEKTMQNADKIFTPIIDKIIEAKIESKRLASLRDTLLPRLMSGELIV